jgi:hypothetical protein
MIRYSLKTRRVQDKEPTQNKWNVLQAPSGAQEVGVYFLAGSGYTTSAVISEYFLTRSRGSAPVSLTVDTSIQSPTSGMGTIATGQLTSSGFQIYAFTTGASTNARAGGVWTVQY